MSKNGQKMIREALARAERQGIKVMPTRSHHYRLTNPTCDAQGEFIHPEIVIVGSTPSDPRSAKNAIARMSRSLGYVHNDK